MSNVYEYQRVRQRKFLYAGLIVLLFGLGYVHRRNVLQVSTMENSLEVSNLGQVDMSGELSRYLLASFRGPLICGMWWEANEKQARHEYDQMEVVITALTKLQPHFKGPWKFQGWNLAYNVSVEFDRVQDKYYYIARGIRWYYEGDRVNVAKIYDPYQPDKLRKVGDPDLRKDLAYTVENKMDRADEAEFYRCFLQLSCIKPQDRQRSANTSETEYVRQLEDFMKKYKILTRRIQYLRDVPDGDHQQLLRELRSFLEQYETSERRRRMPSRYEILSEEKEAELRRSLADPTLSAADKAKIQQSLQESQRPFPVWPPTMVPRDYSVEMLPDEKSSLPGIVRTDPEAMGFWVMTGTLQVLPPVNFVQDGFDIARRWYQYAQEPLPPPNNNWARDYDPLQELNKYTRLQKQGTTISFRAFPVKMRSRLARHLATNGWKEESQITWQMAFDEWLKFGDANGLELSSEKWAELSLAAQPYIKVFPDWSSNLQEPPAHMKDRPDYPQLVKGYEALSQIRRIRQQSVFAHYYFWRTYSECAGDYRSPAAWQTAKDLAEARHCWFRASRLKADPEAALVEYDRGLVHWMRVLGPPTVHMGWREITSNILCRRLGFALSLGITPPQLINPWAISSPVDFTSMEQVQEELADLQDEYLTLRARCLAPQLLKEMQLTLRVGSDLAPLMGIPPLSLAVTEGAARWLTIERVEDWLEAMPGPFDPYFGAHLRESRIDREKTAPMRSFRFENIVGMEELIRRMKEQQEARKSAEAGASSVSP
jgi:hypothetical protein